MAATHPAQVARRRVRSAGDVRARARRLVAVAGCCSCPHARALEARVRVLSARLEAVRQAAGDR